MGRTLVGDVILRKTGQKQKITLVPIPKGIHNRHSQPWLSERPMAPFKPCAGGCVVKAAVSHHRVPVKSGLVLGSRMSVFGSHCSRSRPKLKLLSVALVIVMTDLDALPKCDPGDAVTEF